MLSHTIQIDEPFEFSGPNGARKISVHGLGMVLGPDKNNWEKEYYLVSVDEPFCIDGEIVRQLLCSPRYQVDTLDRLILSECIIGVARVRESIKLKANDKMKTNDVVYCAIGSIIRT